MELALNKKIDAAIKNYTKHMNYLVKKEKNCGSSKEENCSLVREELISVHNILRDLKEKESPSEFKLPDFIQNKYNNTCSIKMSFDEGMVIKESK